MRTVILYEFTCYEGVTVYRWYHPCFYFITNNQNVNILLQARGRTLTGFAFYFGKFHYKRQKLAQIGSH